MINKVNHPITSTSPIRTVRKLIIYPATPHPHLSFKSALLKPFGEFRIWGHESPIPCMDLQWTFSLLQTPLFWYCLHLHCTLGIGTCGFSNNINNLLDRDLIVHSKISQSDYPPCMADVSIEGWLLGAGHGSNLRCSGEKEATIYGWIDVRLAYQLLGKSGLGHIAHSPSG